MPDTSNLVNLGFLAMFSGISFGNSTLRLFANDSGLLVGVYVSNNTVYTKNINQNLLSQSISYVEVHCYVSDTNTTYCKYCFFNLVDVIVIYRGEWTTCMKQVFDVFTTFTQCFMPIIVFMLK